MALISVGVGLVAEGAEADTGAICSSMSSGGGSGIRRYVSTNSKVFWSFSGITGCTDTPKTITVGLEYWRDNGFHSYAAEQAWAAGQFTQKYFATTDSMYQFYWYGNTAKAYGAITLANA